MEARRGITPTSSRAQAALITSGTMVVMATAPSKIRSFAITTTLPAGQLEHQSRARTPPAKTATSREVATTSRSIGELKAMETQ